MHFQVTFVGSFQHFKVFFVILCLKFKVGVSTDEPNHLRYLYENDENFSVLPSLATTISLNAVYQSNILDQAIRQYGLEDNLMRTLHGEQYLRIYRQIPCPSRLACETKILDVLDKGSAGALIIIEGSLLINI